jgi:hypothetical protein
MILSRLITSLVSIAFIGGTISAGDLTKINRKIAKEPAYESKPKYCLLVFGPEAKTRVWIVLDGDTLYVDRNGNGDLTEEGEKVGLPKFTEIDNGFVAGQRQHAAGALTAWPARRLELTVIQTRIRPGHKAQAPEEAEMVKLFGDPPGGLLTGVMVMDEPTKGKVPKGGLADGPINGQIAMADRQGALRFADRAEQAPIVHFSGPLMMSLHPMQKLVRGQETELKASVGTPGLGQGTFVTVMYQGRIPEDAHPNAEVEFPTSGSGKPPLKTKAILSKRC